MVALARALKTREEIWAEQEQGELSPDKAVELQGRLHSIEQDINVMSMRLRVWIRVNRCDCGVCLPGSGERQLMVVRCSGRSRCVRGASRGCI
jgi:hypothetical protein